MNPRHRPNGSPDTLIIFGGEVKALDESGKVGGYLVTFSDHTGKDLDGEYFPVDGYYGPHDGDGADALFHHGIPVKKGLESLAGHFFAPIKTKKDAIGIFAETVLDQSDKYEKAVLELVKAGKIKWSSGSSGRLVQKEKDGKIKRWPIIEGSLTHLAANPFGTEVSAIKSLADLDFEIEEEDAPPQPEIKGQRAPASLAAKLNQHIDDLADDGRPRDAIIRDLATEAGLAVKAIESVLSGEAERPTDANLKAFARVLEVEFDGLREAAGAVPVTIKGIFETTVSEQGFSSWRLWDIMCGVVQKIATVAKNSQAMGIKFDAPAKLDEAYGEFVTRHKKLALAQITDYIEANTDDRFYLKAITDPILDADSTKNIDLDDHSRLAVSALTGVIARFRGSHERRRAEKAGRMLSEKNRKRLMELKGQIDAAAAEMQKLLDESVPMASDAEKRLAQSQFLRLQHHKRISQSGATV